MSIWRARARGALGLLLAGGVAAPGCSGASPGAPGPTWLAREREEQLVQLERQLRGLDVAMVETGYRYGELYWAGRDGNWEAAAYQVDKIRLAIENALERRPKRRASATPFLGGPLAAMGEAVAARDPDLFAARFEDLTEGCNDCHALEEVAFFEVHVPGSRRSPVARGGGAARE